MLAVVQGVRQLAVYGPLSSWNDSATYLGHVVAMSCVARNRTPWRPTRLDHSGAYTAVRPCTRGDLRPARISLSAQPQVAYRGGAGDLELAEQHMPLDGDDMNRLAIEAGQGKDKPSIPSAEAAKFFATVKKQIADLKAKSIMPMPSKD